MMKLMTRMTFVGKVEGLEKDRVLCIRGPDEYLFKETSLDGLAERISELFGPNFERKVSYLPPPSEEMKGSGRTTSLTYVSLTPDEVNYLRLQIKRKQ
jgi:hypothetical protein